MKGLVLGGGGAKGAYQVGAFLAFKKCHIKIDGVVGTSIGSFNAAAICAGKDEELYKFWKNVDVGYLLGLNKKYVKSVNDKKLFKEFIYGLIQTKEIIENKGISTDKLKKALELMVDEEKIRKSKMDFGLVTVKAKSKTLKPLYLFKEDMKEGTIADYILASCNLPVFKMSKMIDDSIYLDGGFYDNAPVKMLKDKGYDEIYVINIQGLGRVPKDYDKNGVIEITPSRYLGSMLSVDKKRINENIKLGYYDTMKVLKKLDGYSFIFKRKPNFIYNYKIKKINEDLLKRVKKYFKVTSNKDAIIKSLEYIMMKEDLTYYDIYSPWVVVKYVKERTNNKHFVYEFIRRF